MSPSSESLEDKVKVGIRAGVRLWLALAPLVHDWVDPLTSRADFALSTNKVANDLSLLLMFDRTKLSSEEGLALSYSNFRVSK